MARYASEKIQAFTAALYAGERLTKEVTAFHLGVDRDTLSIVAARLKLESENQGYPWRRIFRQVHDVEPTKLAACLAQAKADALPGLDDIEDLERALKQPLIDFDVMASALGWKPDTLSKAIRKGRFVLPFPTLELGPRLRCFRPLDVRLWRDAEVKLDYPKPYKPPALSSPTTPACTTDASVSAPARGRGRPRRDAAAAIPPADRDLKEAVFGAFAPDKRIVHG